MKNRKGIKMMGMGALILCFSLFMPAKAVIKFTQATLNFGEVEAGTVVELKFEFENAGDSVLIIESVSASCGCTTVAMNQKEYQPGEKGIIPVKFQSQGYNGAVSKTVTVKTNDEANVFSRLELKGTVKMTNIAVAELSQEEINFATVKPGKKYSQKMTLRNSGTIDLKVEEVTHVPEIYPIFAKSIIPAGGSTEIEIVFHPMVNGNFSSFLKIRTNAFQQRLLVVKVLGVRSQD